MNIDFFCMARPIFFSFIVLLILAYGKRQNVWLSHSCGMCHRYHTKMKNSWVITL